MRWTGALDLPAGEKSAWRHAGPVRVAFLAIAVSVCCQPCALARSHADLILYNGPVITVDAAFSVRSAIAIKEGKILAVGGPELEQRYEATQLIDLRGRAVLPGFTDTHFHIIGTSHRTVDLGPARSIGDVQAAVSAKARELGPGEWIIGRHWSEANFAGGLRPFRVDLDRAAPGNPVVLVRAGGHSAVGNSLALKAAGITRATPDTQQMVIEHDEQGEPNGFVRESLEILTQRVPPDTPEQMRPSYIQELRDALALGITTVIEAGADLELHTPQLMVPSWPEWQSIYATDSARLPRAAVQIVYPGAEVLARFPYHSGHGNDSLKLSAIGERPGVDGGFSGPTVCTTHDYKSQPGFRGRCFMSDAELQSLVDTSARYGWQVGLHMMGDAALNQAMAAYDRALSHYPQNDPRWFASHFPMLASQHTLDLMIKDRIYVSAQPNFVYTFEQRYRDVLSGYDLDHVNPVASLLHRHIQVSFGSDDLPVGPGIGLYAAVTRKGKSGQTIAPAEAVSIQDALRMYTANPAYLTWDEKRKGTLEPGKLADLIVVEQNPLRGPPEALLSLQVDMTIVGGRVVYTRPNAQD